MLLQSYHGCPTLSSILLEPFFFHANKSLESQSTLSPIPMMAS